jgi:hypothetical protein
VVLFVALYFATPLMFLGAGYIAYKRNPWTKIFLFRFMDTFTSKIKIIASHYTVIILFEDVYGLPYPEDFSRFCNYFKVLEVFPALQMLKLSCAVSYNFHSMLYAGSLATFFLMSVIMLNQYVCRVFGPSQVSGLFFVLTFIYPSVSTLTFRTFNCREIDGARFHREDYSIDCGSEEHLFAESFAYAAIVLVSLGLPVMYMVLLWPHRAMLWTGVKATESDVSARNIRFLYSDFTGEYFFWELVDVLRKLVVCGFVVFLEKGSIFRPAVGMMVLLAYITLIIKLVPYKATVDNHLAMCANMAQFLSLAGGLLAMVETGFVSVGEYSMGYDGDSLSVFLIGCFVAVLFIGVVFVSTDVRTLGRSPLIRDDIGNPLVLSKMEEGFYHLFLSHVQGTGEQQCDALKRELELLVPSMKIFKPSENTGNTGSLICIANSDSVLVFLTSGFFSSWGPLLETHEALRLKKNAILMRETVLMHGGGEFSLVSEELDKQKTLLADFSEVCSQDRMQAGDFEGSLIDIRERLFGGDDDMRNVILWHRPKVFNRLALKMVVQRMLEQQGHAEMELHVPGVLSSQPTTPLPVLQPWQRYHICLPQHSPSSAKLLHCFQQKKSPTRGSGSWAPGRPTLGSWAVGRPSRSTTSRSGLRIGICGDADGCTLHNSANMLLLLRTAAFRSEELMDELRQALHLGVHVVTLWERDPAHTIEDFTRFVGTCPHDIRQGKLAAGDSAQPKSVDDTIDTVEADTENELERIAFGKLEKGLINQEEYDLVVAGDRRRAAVFAQEPQSARARIALHKLSQGLFTEQEYEQIVESDARLAAATEEEAEQERASHARSRRRRISRKRTKGCQKLFDEAAVDWFWEPEEYNEASIGVVRKAIQKTTKATEALQLQAAHLPESRILHPAVGELVGRADRAKQYTSQTEMISSVKVTPVKEAVEAAAGDGFSTRSKHSSQLEKEQRTAAAGGDAGEQLEMGRETFHSAATAARNTPALDLTQLSHALESMGGSERRNSERRKSERRNSERRNSDTLPRPSAVVPLVPFEPSRAVVPFAPPDTYVRREIDWEKLDI